MPGYGAPALQPLAVKHLYPTIETLTKPQNPPLVMESKITTCLWFNNKEGEAASSAYIQIFNNAPTKASHPSSEVLSTTHYLQAGSDIHGQEPGSVMTVEFSLRGNRFVALNGGSHGWALSPATSFQIECEDQAEVDYFWGKLGEGGDEAQMRCGWLVDRFGLSWQVVPRELKEMLSCGVEEKVSKVTVEMMGQKKLDIASLKKAFET